VLLLLWHGKMARVLASTPAGEAVPTAAQLQAVGITLLGVWFTASGAIALASDALARLMVTEEEENRMGLTHPPHEYLVRNAEPIATTLVGIAIITIANRIPGWLDRIRRQN